MTAWLPQEWCSSFVLTLGHFAWQGALIAVLLAMTLRAVKSAGARYWLSLAALLVMAACPMVTFGWLMQPVSPVAKLDPPPVVLEEPAPSQPVIPAASEVASDVEQVSNLPVSPPVASLEFNASATLPPVPADSRSWWQRFAPHLTTAYLSGVAVMLLRLVVGLWGGRRLRRRVRLIDDLSLLAAMQRQAQMLGLKLLPMLAYCERVTVPTVIGVLRPMILLPLTLTSGLSPEQIESVLAHELAHLRRYDHLVNLLQRVIESLLFFHPAMWWVSHRIREEREHCCDDLVVACGAMPLDYAKSLLAVAELSRASIHSRPVAAVSLSATGARPSSLRQRIARLLGESATPALRVSPRALLLAIGIPVVAVIATIQSGASNPPIESVLEFGPESNGLRCRLVSVPTTAIDELPDLTKTANQFARGDDVTIAVELQNVSDKPVTLIGVRHEAKGQPMFEGKLAPEFFAPHLFELEFTDADGHPIPRASRVFLETPHLLNGALTHEIAPGMSLVVQLRPAKFHVPMDHRLPPGSYRAKVRYRGPSNKALAYYKQYFPNAPRAQAWSGEVSSNEVTFKVANDPSAPKPQPLVWGAVKDGLQAAVEFRPLPEAAPTNDPPGTFPTEPEIKTIFHVKNVSDRTIKFVSESARQNDEVTATNETGETERLEGRWFSGWPIIVRWTLRPGEIAELHALTSGIGLLKKPGKYTLRYSINFRSLVRNNGNGDDGFPKADDWQQVLVTGDTPVTIRARAGRGAPVSALTPTAGLPISDDETNPPNNANGELRSNPVSEKYSATLPNGDTVELVHLTTASFSVPAEHKRVWWKGDGTLDVEANAREAAPKNIDRAPLNARLVVMRARTSAGEPSLCLKTLPTADTRHLAYSDSKDQQGNPVRTFSAAFGRIGGEKSASLRVGVAPDPWGDWQQISPQGELLNKIDESRPHWSSYQQIKVLRAGPVFHTLLPPAGTPVDPNHWIDTAVVLEWPRNHDELFAFEFRAVSTDGKTHMAIDVAYSQTDDPRRSTFHLNGDVFRDRLARFEYRLRPYRHWVTFENVSLQPGNRTNVKVKTESLPIEPARLGVKNADGSPAQFINAVVEAHVGFLPRA